MNVNRLQTLGDTFCWEGLEGVRLIEVSLYFIKSFLGSSCRVIVYCTNPRCSVSNHPFHSETYFARGVEVTDAGGGGEGCTPLFQVA